MINEKRFLKSVLGHAVSKKVVEYNEVPREQLNRFNNKPRGNQRSFNGLVSDRLGNDFCFKRKACYNCGSFEHLIASCPNYQKPVWNQHTRVNHQNFSKRVHSPSKRNMVPRAVLLRSGVTRTIVAAQPKRPFQNNTTVSTAMSKNLPNTVVGHHFYAVKASACWTWKPKSNGSNTVSKDSSASMHLNKYNYVDAQGKSKSVMAWVAKRN